MADLIDRQVCIDMFQRMAYDDWNQGVNTTWANAFSEAADMIEDLPSVEAEPIRRGHWVYGEDDHGIDGYHCNKCGFFVPWDYTHKFINFIEDYHYCPHCNARMDEVEQDE